MDEIQSAEPEKTAEKRFSIRAPTGGTLYPFVKGDKSQRPIQLKGARTNSYAKRLAKLLKYAPIGYKYNAKAVLELVGCIVDKQRFKQFTAQEFAELVMLGDGIIEQRLAKDVYRDQKTNRLRRKTFSEEDRARCFEIRARLLELALKLGAQLHGDARHGAMQAVQVNIDGKTVEVRPLTVPAVPKIEKGDSIEKKSGN